jgi:DHA1 family multidrug resistance protein-like MFS transporter
MSLANLLITPFLLKKQRPIISCIISGLIGAIAIVITFMVKDQYLIYMVYSVFMVYIISKAIIESASVAYIAENKKVAPGLIMGVRQSFISLGAVIGPLAGGVIYYSYPVNQREILFYICAGIYFITIVVLFFIYIFRNKFKSNPEGGIEECESVD